jgi:hypothetical protein
MGFSQTSDWLKVIQIRQWWISNAANPLPDVLIRKIRQSAVLPFKEISTSNTVLLTW